MDRQRTCEALAIAASAHSRGSRDAVAHQDRCGARRRRRCPPDRGRFVGCWCGARPAVMPWRFRLPNRGSADISHCIAALLTPLLHRCSPGIRAYSAGDPGFSGTVYKESERAREVIETHAERRLRHACGAAFLSPRVRKSLTNQLGRVCSLAEYVLLEGGREDSPQAAEQSEGAG